jgi:Mechanosensitive ion channel, conserved TM helix
MTGIWQTAFVEPIREFFREVGTLLPHLLAMLVIVVIGFAIAWGVTAAVIRLMRVAGFDQFSGRVGFAQALSKGGVRETPSQLIGHLLYWVIVLAFIMLGLGALQLPPVDHFVDQVLSYLPHVLVAVMILVGGFILANFLASAALIAAVNAQVVEARLLARGVWLAMLLLTLAMTFEQLGIAKMVILAAFSITFGGVVLALAIAFGLGAKDAAKAFLEQRLKKEKPKEEEFSHL